jgi:hypothetical protein
MMAHALAHVVTHTLDMISTISMMIIIKYLPFLGCHLLLPAQNRLPTVLSGEKAHVFAC